MGKGPPAHEVTLLLRAWSDGDEQALDRLAPLVYHELRRIAGRYMVRERLGHTLQATALVNEAYLRLVDVHRVNWQDRAHFYAICARAMRRILVDHARSRSNLKHGAGQAHLELDDALNYVPTSDANFLELDDALKRLATLDERKSQVVELRFFGGLSVEETAEVLKISPETVMRDWKMAKAWLYREMSGSERDES